LRAVRAVQSTYIERLQQRGHPGLRTGHIPVFAGLNPEVAAEPTTAESTTAESTTAGPATAGPATAGPGAPAVPDGAGPRPGGAGAPGGTRITDLANRAGMTRQMMGRLVRELEALGYLTTATHPDDQRAVVVTMTERGHAIRAEAAEVIAELEADYAVLLHDSGLAQLKGALQNIIRTSPTA
jgi:DNA-binding MarR family transcriptional regulator